MQRIALLLVAVANILAAGQRTTAQANDWPTLRRDERRSGVAEDPLDFNRLTLAWTHRPDQPPCPAWPGPARWDAYVKRSIISSMRNYDESFHVTVSDGKLYFGSSADDAVHCLDAESGEECWNFPTGGPVRLPPTIADGKLYFGSDDGHLYCVAIDQQKLLWKFRPGGMRLLPNDGRLISQWPVRTAVLVKDNLVYAGASLLPWEKSYLCALNAENGNRDLPGTYVCDLEGATLEGSILSDGDQLLVTQGRAAPLWLTRSTGKSRGRVPGVHGGSFALIAADGTRYIGPGPREGFLSEANSAHTAAIARKFGAMALVAHDGKVFDLERRFLGCMRQKPEEWLWRRPSDLEESLILVGDVLVAGGNGKVVAFQSKDGKPVWQAKVEGRAQGLAAAEGKLFVSTDAGLIYAFRADDSKPPGDHASSDYRVSAPLTYDPIPATRPPREIRRGPIIRFSSPGRAIVTWDTTSPTPTTLVSGIEGFDSRYHDPQPRVRHEVQLTGLGNNTVYRCAIVLEDDAEGTVVGPFECDTHMNFSPPTASAGLSEININSELRSRAGKLVTQLDHNAGVCVALGIDTQPLAEAIAVESRLKTVLLDSSESKIASARRKLLPTGVYGTRISLLEVDSLHSLQTPSNFANLVVISSALVHDGGESLAKELIRVVCPRSGRIYVDYPTAADAERHKDRLKSWFAQVSMEFLDRGVMISKPEAGGRGSWTHQYGRADNATFAGESLEGACRTTDFEVQWLGRPGPRFQSDRGNRKPAPLYAGGRMFAQGLDRVLAMDAANGTILWNLEIPDSRRFNIRHDSANWCVDDDALYLAVRDACWAIDSRTGQLLHEFMVPDSSSATDWGYVGRQRNRLIGSSVPEQSAFKEFWGGEYWYTNPEGPLAAKVCGRTLFAHDVASRQKVWQYDGGAIVNASITLTDELVIFVESLHPAVLSPSRGRVAEPELWSNLHLVALSLQDGSTRWRKPLDIGLATTMFSLAAGDGCVVALASARGDYRLKVLAEEDGRALWETTFPWEAIGKGGDSARPAILGKTLYVSPRAFQLKTGEQLPLKLTRGACGSYAAAANVFITRLGNLGLWDPQSNVATSWDRLRPDCWLSAIPAGGLILAPEGGGGCSCGGWIETSIAFAPRSAAIDARRNSQRSTSGN